MSDERKGVPSFFLFTTGVALCLAVGYLIPWGSSEGAARGGAEGLVAELGDPATRTAAYVRLAERGAAAAPALLAAARDPAFPARAEAIELLGRARSADALPFLLGLDEPALADERLTALGRIRGEQALAALLTALASGDRLELRFPALRALASWPGLDADVVAQRVVPYLDHAQWGLRELAARAVGEHRHAPATPRLIELLGDGEPAVRQTAAWALMQIGDPEGRAAVERALAKGAVAFEE